MGEEVTSSCFEARFDQLASKPSSAGITFILAVRSGDCDYRQVRQYVR